MPYQTVSSRTKPDFDPVGGRVGSFILFPSIEISEEYDDNIFKEQTDEDSDFITSIRPKLLIKSQWNNHELNFDAEADARQHADSSDEDTTDYFLGADGRIDVRRSTQLFGAASYRRLHEDRGNPNTPGASKEPVQYDLIHAIAGAGHKFNRLGISLSGSMAGYEYEDAVDRLTGATIIQSDRNRDEYELGLRVGYEIRRALEVFARGVLNYRDYERLQAGFDRESDGFEVVLGTALDFAGSLFGEVFAGYKSQEYDDPRLATIEGPVIGGSIFWNPSGLTTINPFVSRRIEETTVGSSSGIFATTIGVKIDHELLRSLLLNGSVSFRNDRYEGSTTGVQERDDDYFSYGLGATYLVNRHFRAGIRYDFESRESNIAGSDYDNNIVSVSLRLQL